RGVSEEVPRLVGAGTERSAMGAELRWCRRPRAPVFDDASILVARPGGGEAPRDSRRERGATALPYAPPPMRRRAHALDASPRGGRASMPVEVPSRRARAPRP